MQDLHKRHDDTPSFSFETSSSPPSRFDFNHLDFRPATSPLVDFTAFPQSIVRTLTANAKCGPTRCSISVSMLTPRRLSRGDRSPKHAKGKSETKALQTMRKSCCVTCRQRSFDSCTAIRRGAKSEARASPASLTRFP
jgi:hypothetical protein